VFEYLNGFDESLKEPLFIVDFAKKLKENNFVSYYQPFSLIETDKVYRNIFVNELEW